MYCLEFWTTLFILFTGCSFSASRNVSDWWLAYWISHSRGNSTATHHHVNFSSANSLNHLIPRVLTADQLDMPHVHIVKDTITFYLVVYGGLAVANTVRELVLTLPLSDASVCSHLDHRENMISLKSSGENFRQEMEEAVLLVVIGIRRLYPPGGGRGVTYFKLSVYERVCCMLIKNGVWYPPFIPFFDVIPRFCD